MEEASATWQSLCNSIATDHPNDTYDRLSTKELYYLFALDKDNNAFHVYSNFLFALQVSVDDGTVWLLSFCQSGIYYISFK